MLLRNQIVLDATVHKKGLLRYTPAGLPVFDLVLAHQSEQGEPPQKVWVEIDAIAFGPLATEIAAVEFGSVIGVKGFLNRKSRTNSAPQINITQFKFHSRG